MSSRQCTVSVIRDGCYVHGDHINRFVTFIKCMPHPFTDIQLVVVHAKTAQRKTATRHGTTCRVEGWRMSDRSWRLSVTFWTSKDTTCSDLYAAMQEPLNCTLRCLSDGDTHFGKRLLESALDKTYQSQMPQIEIYWAMPVSLPVKRVAKTPLATDAIKLKQAETMVRKWKAKQKLAETKLQGYSKDLSRLLKRSQAQPEEKK